MKSITIISLIVSLINADSWDYQPFLDSLDDFYDALVNMGESQNRATCTEMNQVMDLLSNDFEYCTSDEPCMNRSEYYTLFKTHACGLYESIIYQTKINQIKKEDDNDDDDDDDAIIISITWQVIFVTNDGCTINATESHMIHYNDQELISKFYDETFIEPDTHCINTTSYQHAATMPESVQSKDGIDGLEKLYQFYDAQIAMGVSKNRKYCPEMNDLMGFLSDDFQYCPWNETCMDKIEYQDLFKEVACGLYEKIDYNIQLQPNDQDFDDYPMNISLIWNATFYPINGDVTKLVEQHIIYFNENELITRYGDENKVESRDDGNLPQDQEDDDTQKKMDELEYYYDTLVDVFEVKYDENCEKKVNDRIDLLSDNYQYCTYDGECYNKSEYQIGLTSFCGEYDDVSFSIKLDPSNQSDPRYTSLIMDWTKVSYGCTRMEHEKHEIYYDDEGLVRQFIDTPLSNPRTKCVLVANDIESDSKDETEQLEEFYDALVAMGESKNRMQCPEMDNVMNLLSNDFQYCTVNDGCMNRNEYQILFTNHACGLYKSIIYQKKINQVEVNDDDETVIISLSWPVIFITNDDCTINATESHVIHYDDDGLISKFDDETFIEPTTENCPPSTSAPDAAPIPESKIEAKAANISPNAEDDYVSTDINTAVIIDVLENMHKD